MIDKFFKVRQSDEAMELPNEAMEMEHTSTIVTSNVVLNGYFKEGSPLERLQILKEMARSG